MYYLKFSDAQSPGDFVLTLQRWNDWWKYENLYTLYVRQKDNRFHEVGHLKIGDISTLADEETHTPNLPNSFSSLDVDQFVSLGQDETFYSNLNNLGVNVRNVVLTSLNDIAYNLEYYERYKLHDVVKKSLMRFVSPATIQGQFHRMAYGGLRLTPYSFCYKYPKNPNTSDNVILNFDVIPDSCPPSNIHVIIGRNAVGKTRLIRSILSSICNPGNDEKRYGSVLLQGSNQEFSNVICLGFSIFDSFPETLESSKIHYTFIGASREEKDPSNDSSPQIISESLRKQFTQSITNCMTSLSRYERWKNIIEELNSDPIFSAINLVASADYIQNNRTEYTRTQAEAELGDIFDKLSSGHKIVALTITRLVETVEECSLVLLDEPELHLHPPLLSAFTRALSQLLVNRNGVAIIATHSPVILQEVPRNCAWVLNRDGYTMSAHRPTIETFGENVGILTSSVFKLEVTHSGFHKFMYDKLKENNGNYQKTIDDFNGNLGKEAQMILKMMEFEFRSTEDETP